MDIIKNLAFNIKYFIVISSIFSSLNIYSQINTKFDEYAQTFRQTDLGKNLELWYTTNNGLSNTRSRIMVSSKLKNGIVGPMEILPYPLNQKISENSKIIPMDGSPAFPINDCNGISGVFVSNRLYKNNFYDNDIYEMTYINGEWSVKRIDAINSEYWDDTPSLSPDGKVLVFSSDRRSYGKRIADIYISWKTQNGWSTPVLLDNKINSDEFSEEAPYLSKDGYMYFASNKTGDYDIYRIKVDTNYYPLGIVESLNIPNVNKSGSDETHPKFSPSGGWFSYSTNAMPEGSKDFNIIFTESNKEYQEVKLKVMLMTRIFDYGTGIKEDVSSVLSTSINILDLSDKSEKTIESDQQGNAIMRIPPIVGKDISQDARTRSFIVKAIPKSPKWISAEDTLIIDSWCNQELFHTIYLYDTTSIYDAACSFTYTIKNVEYFVNAYWCPTTKKFKRYTPCTSLFMENGCKEAPEPPCESNEIYVYKVQYDFYENKTYENCIDYRDYKINGERYAVKVDSAIEGLQKEMISTFNIPCIRRAIREKKKIKVEIMGFTDPNSLHLKCRYIGNDIIIGDNNIVINNEKFDIVLSDSSKAKKIYNGKINKGMLFRKTEQGGNQLLSDLRGIYTSILFDRYWKETIPEYNDLRNKGMITVETFGKAISQEKVEFARKRSVIVRITVPDLPPIFIAGKKPNPGKTVKFPCEDEDCK
ncbi:MAG: hypothetical protein QXG00_08525 [Candidatus Woesearchaeota archaeon]